MRIYREKDYEKMSQKAAEMICAQIMMKPDCVLGLATGSTPVRTYEKLVERYQNKEIDFSEAVSVNLDEYRGISKDNAQSYHYFMRRHLFDHINMKAFYLPDGMEEDTKKECRRYEELIASLGGIDLQLLGLGNNGHIGFNEPGESFEKETHCVCLHQSTIEANKRFFQSAEEVPKQACTMGIGTIMQAKKILILVSGEKKAEMVKRAFWGPITPRVPASILQIHQDVTLIGDEAALSKIPDCGRKFG